MSRLAPHVTYCATMPQASNLKALTAYSSSSQLRLTVFKHAKLAAQMRSKQGKALGTGSNCTFDGVTELLQHKDVSSASSFFACNRLTSDTRVRCGIWTSKKYYNSWQAGACVQYASNCVAYLHHRPQQPRTNPGQQRHTMKAVILRDTHVLDEALFVLPDFLLNA